MGAKASSLGLTSLANYEELARDMEGNSDVSHLSGLIRSMQIGPTWANSLVNEYTAKANRDAWHSWAIGTINAQIVNSGRQIDEESIDILVGKLEELGARNLAEQAVPIPSPPAVVVQKAQSSSSASSSASYSLSSSVMPAEEYVNHADDETFVKELKTLKKSGALHMAGVLERKKDDLLAIACGRKRASLKAKRELAARCWAFDCVMKYDGKTVVFPMTDAIMDELRERLEAACPVMPRDAKAWRLTAPMKSMPCTYLMMTPNAPHKKLARFAFARVRGPAKDNLYLTGFRLKSTKMKEEGDNGRNGGHEGGDGAERYALKIQLNDKEGMPDHVSAILKELYVKFHAPLNAHGQNPNLLNQQHAGDFEIEAVQKDVSEDDEAMDMEDDPDDAEAKRRGDHGIIGGGGMGAGMVHAVTEGGGDLQGQGNNTAAMLQSAQNRSEAIKRGRRECSEPGCVAVPVKGGRCIDHGGMPYLVKKRECSDEGCSKYAVGGGKCIAHGGKQKKRECQEAGCTNYAQRGGKCQLHGGTPYTYNKKMCEDEGCVKQAVRRGLCISHGGSRPRTKCNEPNCVKYAKKSGKCSTHARLPDDTPV